MKYPKLLLLLPLTLLASCAPLRDMLAPLDSRGNVIRAYPYPYPYAYPYPYRYHYSGSAGWTRDCADSPLPLHSHLRGR